MGSKRISVIFQMMTQSLLFAFFCSGWTLHQMDWDSSGDDGNDSVALMDDSSPMFESRQLKPRTSGISEREFSCHCCYDILVNPTTLTCGHNFCRHCLALWWESSRKNECPECREKWEGFPKINILMRYYAHSYTNHSTRCCREHSDTLRQPK